MLRDIYLYGHLEEKFGHHHRYDVDSVCDAVRCMRTMHDGFIHALKEGSYQLIRGDFDGDDFIPLSGVEMKLGMAAIHIVPVVEGSAKGGTKGIITAVVGLALVATALVLSGGTAAGLAETAITLPGGLGSATYGQLALMGGLLALGGIYSVVAPQVLVDKYDRDEQPTSYLFSGAENRTEQGGCVPVLYGGPFEVGSRVVNIGFEEKQIKGGDPDTGFIVTITCGDNGTCSPIGAVHLNRYSYLTIKFLPESGYLVDSVTVDGLAAEFQQDEYTIGFITANHTVHIEFAAITEDDHQITALSSGPGSVSPPGRTFVGDGEDLTIDVIPSQGGELIHLDVDGTIVLPPLTSYTFSNVTGDHTLTAYFRFET